MCLFLLTIFNKTTLNFNYTVIEFEENHFFTYFIKKLTRYQKTFTTLYDKGFLIIKSQLTNNR